jgi:arsenate reductase-like glutaredoxin family protein
MDIKKADEFANNNPTNYVVVNNDEKRVMINKLDEWYSKKDICVRHNSNIDSNYEDAEDEYESALETNAKVELAL